MPPMTRIILFSLVLLPLLTATARAKNVDLVTLPSRDGVQLTIYNSEDLTLVKERRHITVKRGANKLQFSWANTLIDPSSVEFRALEHTSEVEVADTVFPGQKPQFLVWNLESEFEGQLAVEVSYFTSGIRWEMDYVGVVNPGETTMNLDGYVRVYNNSGEPYEGAEIRLIVGNINLVEKIADLARRRGIPVPQPSSFMEASLRRDSAKTAFGLAGGARLQARVAKEKGVVKEGISEYFMFSVEGQETIRNGWSKRMRALKTIGSSFDVVYRMRAFQYGLRPVRFFLWKNSEDHQLGESPLPDGRIRIFRENGREGLSYLGEQLVRYVPIDAPVEVNVGPDDLVVYETRKDATARSNFAFKHGRVTGWDERTHWMDTIRNYRDKPIHFELRRRWSGHIDYTKDEFASVFDYRTIEADFTVKARGTFSYPANVLQHHGSNTKQNRIDLR